MNEPIAILRVDDQDTDVALVRAVLTAADIGPHTVQVAGSVADASRALSTAKFDVVLTDLGLPDARGVETVEQLASKTKAPIVVLTGSEDLGPACIEAGAQDFIVKADLVPRTLQRALTFALVRRRNRQKADLEDTLERLRVLMSGAETSTQSPPRADGRVRAAHRPVIDEIDVHYRQVLLSYLEHLAERGPRPDAAMQGIGMSLFDLGAGQRDLIGVHVRALQRCVRGAEPDMARAYAVAARSLLLDMLGVLTRRYRDAALADESM